VAKSILDLNDDGKIDMEDIKHLLLRYEIILVGGLLLIVLLILIKRKYIKEKRFRIHLTNPPKYVIL